MAGGLMQLLAFGNQNIYLNGNPSMTYFKKVFHTHTNFAMESISVVLSRTTANIYQPTLFQAKVPRHSDLIQEVYFVMELPDIVSNDDYRFRWIENVGEAVIKSSYVRINGTQVDAQSGEFMHIRNQLGLSVDKRVLYDKLIGNVKSVHTPTEDTDNGGTLAGASRDYVVTANAYPSSDDPAIPSIVSRKLYIPLQYWFNKDPGNALPLVSLQYSETEIVVEIQPLMSLFRLLGGSPLGYRAPSLTNPDHNLKNFITDTNQFFGLSTSLVDVKAYLEINYVYLDEKERLYIAHNPIEYLIEQTTVVQYRGLLLNTSIDLVLQNPVKELYWVIKRSDLDTTNDWFNFMDNRRHIMATAKLSFNGLDRLDSKDFMYYNYVQPFQHHKGGSKDGIYMYSFSLSPDDYQPSGSCNFSRINKTQLQIVLQNAAPADGSYTYDISIYSVAYNFLKVSDGTAGVVFVL